MWRDQFYVDGVRLRVGAFDGGRRDKAGKIERRMTQIEITAEDYAAALTKILQDTLENPESRARVVRVAENLQNAAQTFAERYRLFCRSVTNAFGRGRAASNPYSGWRKSPIATNRS